MIRTRISLDADVYALARAEAKRQGISLAEFLRRSVTVALQPRVSTDRPWMRHAGVLSSGDSRASTTVDDVIYGRPRP